MASEIAYEIDGEWNTVTLDRDELTVGRDKRNDIVLPIPWISRKHARIYRAGEGWRVADLGSSFGTRINDLDHTNAVLRDGDRIYLHTFALVFRDSTRDARPDVSLTGQEDEASHQALGHQTVFQSAVDFSSLASRTADAQRSQRLLRMVTETSRAILASRDLDETFAQVLELVFRQVPAQRGFIMLCDEKTGELAARAIKVAERGGSEPQIRFSRTIARRVVEDRVGVLTRDAQADQRFASGASVIELDIRSAMAAPVWQDDRVEGLIYVDTLRSGAFDEFDLDVLSAIGNHLAIAIEQSRLQQSVVEQQLVRRRLERYHSPAVAEMIARRAETPEGGLLAEEREVTVLFADVVSFTSRCERMEPREVADLLNRYFSEMTECVFQHNGTLDKFIGDCLMAVFGAPLATPDHARHAAEAVLDMREALRRLNEPLPEPSRLQFRVGLHSGRVVAGDIGSRRRSDYTVLGSAVNLAARLEGAVAAPGQIVLSEATHEAIGSDYETRPLGEHRPKGLSQPVRCFELIGRRDAGGEMIRETGQTG